MQVSGNDFIIRGIFKNGLEMKHMFWLCTKRRWVVAV